MPNAGAEKFPPRLLLQSEQGKMAGNGAGQQKKQQIFFRLTAFAGRAGGGWYSVLKVWADWLDNLGFFYLTNWDLLISIPIKVSIYIRLSEQLADT